jgi:hypothetical protein
MLLPLLLAAYQAGTDDRKKMISGFLQNSPKSLCFQWVHVPKDAFPNSVIPSEIFHTRAFI